LYRGELRGAQGEHQQPPHVPHQGHPGMIPWKGNDQLQCTT
jgi:hypothetical protein